MPIEKEKAILLDGVSRGYGVPMINVINYETIRWAIEVAEEEGMPLLIGLYPGFASHLDPCACAELTKLYAGRVRVPIALHLDHSPSLEVILPYLKWFDSVMIDGSSLPYEENLRVTAETVRICHAMGVDVEAELGHVGSGASIDDIANEAHYTDPAQAAEFAERTGVDSLAVAIGNAHGAYIAAPKLDFARLSLLRKAVAVPLVLHGGSGIPDEQFARCAAMGMSKFNVFTEYNMAFSNACKEYFKAGDKGALAMLTACEAPCKEVVRHKIRTLNPRGLRAV